MDKYPEDQNLTNDSKKKRPFFSKRVKNILKISSIIIGTGILFVLGTGTGYVASVVKNEPVRDLNFIQQKVNANAMTSFAYFRDGSLIGQLQTEEDRLPVKVKDVSPYLINAIISTEDKNFYSHPGVDFTGVIRAAYQQVTGAPVKTGGSTLTQQLVKQTFLSPEKTTTRKVKEIFLSLRVERALTKDQILEAYINRMYFGKNKNGSNLYGIESAAQGIFGVDAKDLTLAQSTYLAGMLQLPGKYIPFSNIVKNGYENGIARQKIVLQRMLENGKITQKDYDAALKVDLKSQLKSTEISVYKQYPFLNAEIERRVAQTLADQEIAKNPDLKNDDYEALVEDKLLEVRQGGYHVYTTIDKNVYETMQQVGQNPNNYDRTRVDSTGKSFPEQAGAIMIDNKTGAILGMLEGRDFNTAQTSHIIAPRQPGSTMKPIGVYGPALEEGIVQPGSIIDDAPYTINGYTPQNYDSGYLGKITIRTAIANSRNIPAVKTFVTTGIAKSLSYVKKMGVTSLIEKGRVNDYNASSAIGGLTYGISIEELTNAFATFPNQGTFVKDYMIEKIENANHQVIYQHQTQTNPVFSQQTAWLMNNMLTSVIQDPMGTAKSVQKYRMGRVVAGKTGTTQNSRDILFVGYTPDITMGVWVGYDKSFPDGNGNFESVGGERAKVIWGQIFSNALSNNPAISPAGRNFSQPGGIVQRTVDQTNGDLATPQSASTVTEYFNAKFAPSKYSTNTLIPQGTNPTPIPPQQNNGQAGGQNGGQTNGQNGGQPNGQNTGQNGGQPNGQNTGQNGGQPDGQNTGQNGGQPPGTP